MYLNNRRTAPQITQFVAYNTTYSDGTCVMVDIKPLFLETQ